jgi:Domain of unknown function (DUF4294)
MSKSFTHKIIFTAIFWCVCSFTLQAQEKRHFGANDTIKTLAVVYGGDTLSFYYMEMATVTAIMSEEVKAAMAKQSRLRNAVYVTYPYAINAASVLNDVNAHLNGITNPAARRRYIRSREKELRRNFTDKLSNLSVYQGKVLMKIIYRETGEHCYEIIKELKGGATARFWQTVAFVFGSSLKQTYNPNGDDAEMEVFVKEVARMYGRT